METACFSCGKATGGCSWSSGFTPVEGWDAIQTRNSFCVTFCPEYRHDTGLPKELDTDGVLKLLEAVMARTCEDYVYGIGPSKDKGTNRAALEAIIRTREFCTLFLLEDPEALILALRRRLTTMGVF